jgi:hypothetical protein
VVLLALVARYPQDPVHPLKINPPFLVVIGLSITEEVLFQILLTVE